MEQFRILRRWLEVRKTSVSSRQLMRSLGLRPVLRRGDMIWIAVLKVFRFLVKMLSTLNFF